MTLAVAIEPLQRLLDDGLADLAALHFLECETDAPPYAPDWARCLEMERLGLFVAISLRRDGRLIGYSLFVLAGTLHTRSTVEAFNDAVYVDPAERKGPTGVVLLRRTERLLAARGARRLIYRTKLHGGLGARDKSATVGRLLERLGYSPAEVVHVKWSGDR
jgi:GNAT superfamily N-acetyltransferase